MSFNWFDIFRSVTWVCSQTHGRLLMSCEGWIDLAVCQPPIDWEEMVWMSSFAWLCSGMTLTLNLRDRGSSGTLGNKLLTYLYTTTICVIQCVVFKNELVAALYSSSYFFSVAMQPIASVNSLLFFQPEFLTHFSVFHLRKLRNIWTIDHI